MSPPLVAPNWGIFLLAIPFLCALPLGILRLEARLVLHRSRRTIAPGMEIHDDAKEFFTDPNGRPWYPAQRAK